MSTLVAPRSSWTVPAVGVAGAVVALGIGAVAGARPVPAALGLGVAAVAALCLVGPRCRLLVVVAGALVVFQSEQTVLKYAYLGLVTLCCALSLPALLGPDRAVRREYRPIVLGAALLVLYLGFTVLVARQNGSSLGSWFRDTLAYLLLAMFPFVGIAAGPTLTERRSRWWLVALALAASVSLATYWMERRGVSALSIGRVLLPSTVLVALGFAIAVVAAMLPGRPRAVRAVWAATAAVVLVALLLTGSRTNLVVLAAFVGVLGLARTGLVPVWRVVLFLGGLIGGLALLAPTVTRLLIADPSFLPQRVEEASRVLSGETGRDQSFEQRSLSYEWTARELAARPVLGTGPGHLYATPDSPTVKTFTLDTPILTVAKFGLLGTAVLVAFLAGIAVTYRRLRADRPRHPMAVATRGWLAVVIVLVPFGAVFEDKGLGLALALVLALVVGELREHGTDPP